MNIQRCNARHRCADGGEGECSSILDHYGRHVCARCLSPFTGAETGPSGRIPSEPPPGIPLRQADGPRPGPDHAVGRVTDYTCAHCGRNYAWEEYKCPNCGFLVCQDCSAHYERCPKVYRECAHCGKRIPTLGNHSCVWCGFDVCDGCYSNIYTCRKAPKCYHCGGSFTRQDYNKYLCWCNQIIHYECAAKCPNRPVEAKALPGPPPSRLDIPRPAAARPLGKATERACAHCGRNFGIENNKCPYCDRPICLSCNPADCPRIPPRSQQ